MNFNYQKAYCTQAVPAFNKLPKHVKEAHAKLLPLVGDLQQGRDLDIPLNDKITRILEKLETEEIAKLSRVSYFVGHWHPGLLPTLFSNTKGESWKVSNCCDQLLRQRLNTPHNIQIHEGKLRVTFSSLDCWLWEEFALATEENLKTFKRCKLSFGEETLNTSAKALKDVIGDLWGCPDKEKDNALYKKYLKLRREDQEKKIAADFERKIEGLKKDQEAAQKEIDFLLMCNGADVPIDNVIYYKHTDTFCFGWRESISDADLVNEITEKLKKAGNTFNIEFK
jgi:hypothetical protein